LLFLSQIAKGVDDHAENQVQSYNYDNEKEEQVIDDSEDEQWLLKI
jgi:hypothetical protein